MGDQVISSPAFTDFPLILSVLPHLFGICQRRCIGSWRFQRLMVDAQTFTEVQALWTRRLRSCAIIEAAELFNLDSRVQGQLT
jgi:hypothetical protein